MVPLIQESRSLVAQMSQATITDDEVNSLYSALVVDGERANLVVLSDSIGMNQDFWANDRTITREIKNMMQHEDNKSKEATACRSNPYTTILSSDGMLMASHAAIKNLALGKFGARCSGKHQFLDLSPVFMNVKKRLNYWVTQQYRETIDEKAPIQYDYNAQLLEYYLKSFARGTQDNPKSKYKEITFPPLKAKKLAVVAMVTSIVVTSFATPEIIKKGYKKALVMEILKGDYVTVMEDQCVNWYHFEDNYKQKMVEEIIPQCISAMSICNGLIPEEKFDE